MLILFLVYNSLEIVYEVFDRDLMWLFLSEEFKIVYFNYISYYFMRQLKKLSPSADKQRKAFKYNQLFIYFNLVLLFGILIYAIIDYVQNPPPKTPGDFSLQVRDNDLYESAEESNHIRIGLCSRLEWIMLRFSGAFITFVLCITGFYIVRAMKHQRRNTTLSNEQQRISENKKRKLAILMIVFSISALDSLIYEIILRVRPSDIRCNPMFSPPAVDATMGFVRNFFSFLLVDIVSVIVLWSKPIQRSLPLGGQLIEETFNFDDSNTGYRNMLVLQNDRDGMTSGSLNETPVQTRRKSDSSSVGPSAVNLSVN
eukprot:CAMPEP_0115001740 /NCGR_PEP_ID=MMETSP0216-20121206/17573_1 /TAXON_ID=223996 /ORGANISM="Protocruzia adherens, Strain Boccale" /LENGTH=312 /DNA_ID=CAMNT_0002367167 /DNA_START=168 /DNA_END=1106 /DNA_ORIENTATION=+